MKTNDRRKTVIVDCRSKEGMRAFAAFLARSLQPKSERRENPHADVVAPNGHTS